MLSDTEINPVQWVQIYEGLKVLPSLAVKVEELNRQLTAAQDKLSKINLPNDEGGDGWLDTKAAIRYLSVSPSTFDKYRYSTTPKIKGYRLDGKTLYKKADLDRFVMLYEPKSEVAA